jgi:hypothetical protein
MYADWIWRPHEMGVDRFDVGSLSPFWKDPAARGVAVGVLDVPSARPLSPTRGFEVCDWGQHHGFVVGEPHADPATVNGLLNGARHPFDPRPPDTAGPDDYTGLSRLSAACVAGARLRGDLAARLIGEAPPDLAIIVFQEAHVAGHRLSHALADRSALPASALTDVYAEIDRQVGRLTELWGHYGRVIVFSLHGMLPIAGTPTVLDAWLREQGLARSPTWRTRSPRERGVEAIAAIKRNSPMRVKRLYYRLMSQPMVDRIANTTRMLPHDWSRTRAFSLPDEQHGMLRVNVAGREAGGIVPPERYDESCASLERSLRALRTPDGRPLVRNVVRMSHEVGQALPQELPDLVVHWDDAAYDRPARVAGTAIEAHPGGGDVTGHHAPDGFCILPGDFRHGLGETVAAEDLHRPLVGALGGVRTS